MCRAATCPTCSKASWFGCGQHIPSVMDSVPDSDWCSCVPKHEFDGKQYPPKSGTGIAKPAPATQATQAAPSAQAGAQSATGGVVEGVKNFMGWALGSAPEKKGEL